VKLVFAIPPEETRPARGLLDLGSILQTLCPDHKRLRFLRDPSGEARHAMMGLMTGYSSTAVFSPEQIRQSSALSEPSEENYAALWQEALNPDYDVVVVVACVHYTCGFFRFLVTNVFGESRPVPADLVTTNRLLVLDETERTFSFIEEAKPA
jgi:hypothetical protein